MSRHPVVLAGLVLVTATAVAAAAPESGGVAEGTPPVAEVTVTDRDGDGAIEPWERAPAGRETAATRGSVTADPIEAGGAPARPNLLVLMTDDMRDDDLRFMPHVRRLVGGEGVRFTQSFSPQPLCCPARASFLTGRLTHNHGVWSHRDPFGFRVFDDTETLPVWLQRAGYSTSFFGKYLNGYGAQTRLDGSSSLRYVPPGWSDWRASVDTAAQAAPELDGGTYRYFDTTLGVNGTLEPHEGEYQTHLLSRLTQDVIREAARAPQPFFAWTSFVAPHVGGPDEPDDPGVSGSGRGLGTPARPTYVQGRFDDAITRIPGEVDEPGTADKPYFIARQPPLSPADADAVLESFRQRVEALSVVDEEVAHILETLRRTGQLDDTYVVFTSDNGFFLGEHRRRSGKILPYEPSLRVPLLVRGPGIPAGEERADPALTVDLTPTLLTAAGLRPPASIDGVSLLDTAREGDRGWTRGILTETGPRTLGSQAAGVVDRSQVLDRPDGPSRLRFSQGLRTGRWLYVEHASREQELYDLREDPRQFVNLVDQRRLQPLVARLARHLDLLRDCSGAECSRPLPRSLRTHDPAPVYVAQPTRRSTPPEVSSP